MPAKKKAVKSQKCENVYISGGAGAQSIKDADGKRITKDMIMDMYVGSKNVCISAKKNKDTTILLTADGLTPSPSSTKSAPNAAHMTWSAFQKKYPVPSTKRGGSTATTSKTKTKKAGVQEDGESEDNEEDDKEENTTKKTPTRKAPVSKKTVKMAGVSSEVIIERKENANKRNAKTKVAGASPVRRSTRAKSGGNDYSLTPTMAMAIVRNGKASTDVLKDAKGNEGQIVGYIPMGSAGNLFVGDPSLWYSTTKKGATSFVLGNYPTLASFTNGVITPSTGMDLGGFGLVAHPELAGQNLGILINQLGLNKKKSDKVPLVAYYTPDGKLDSISVRFDTAVENNHM